MKLTRSKPFCLYEKNDSERGGLIDRDLREVIRD